MPAYLAFLVALASVAAGHGQDAWIAALSGWFLIHGYASFLFFIPLLVLAAHAALAWPRRRALGSAVRALSAGQKRVWVPVVAISAVFMLPIALELALHWPGNFGKYLAYSSSSKSGGANGLPQVAHYALWFWWPHARVWAAAPALCLLAGFVAWRLRAGPVRRFCWSLIAFDALSTILFAYYATTGVGALSQYFAGYFYWSAPIIVLLVIALGALEALQGQAQARVGRGVAATATTAAVSAAVLACAAFAIAPQTRTSTSHTDPGDLTTGADTDPSLAAGVAHVAALSGGRPIVLRFAHNAWPAVTGFLVQAERFGVTACVADPSWEFMLTSQFTCTPAELTDGVNYQLYVPGAVPRGTPVVFRLRRALVTAAGK